MEPKEQTMFYRDGVDYLIFHLLESLLGLAHMNLVGVQFDIAWKDRNANFCCVRRLLGTAQIEAGSMVVLPEMFASGFSMDAATVAEEKEGDTACFLGQLARDLGVYVLAGTAFIAGEGMARNEALVMGPDGVELTRSTKLHPFSLSREAAHYVPGDGVCTFRWDRFTVAPFICYDLRFPEVFREAVCMGANLLIVIANWPRVRETHWDVLLRARAIENQSYVLGVNRCGNDPKHQYSGHSMIIDPRGEIVSSAGVGEGLVQAALDFADLEAYRREFPALRDRRF